MASDRELAAFLKSIEGKAFKRTVFSTKDEEAALDIVQDSMLKLSQKYGHVDASELPLLFTRILQNTTLDWFRRQKTQNTWISLFSALRFSNADQDENDSDPLEFIGSDEANSAFEDGLRQLERKEMIEILENEISKLPTRQREAFLMRYWDELDIAQTAKIMGCSEGSVKTHCSRAVSSLAKAFKNKGLDRDNWI